MEDNADFKVSQYQAHLYFQCATAVNEAQFKIERIGTIGGLVLSRTQNISYSIRQHLHGDILLSMRVTFRLS